MQAEQQSSNTNIAPTRRFQTKVILVAGGSVLIGLALSGAVALHNFNNLGRDASEEIQNGLSEASREYLENYIETTTERTSLMLDRAFSELRILGELMQWAIDHPEENRQMGDLFSTLKPFEDNLTYNKKGDWQQNAPTEPAVVSVWGHLLKDGVIREDVARHIKNTAYLDMILPAIKNNGAQKLYMYMVGPREMSYLRLSPYVDMATEFDTLYPGHNKENFWDFFFPNLVDSWQKWADSGMTKQELTGRITITAPYEDAAGGGIIISSFHPLWSDNYTKFAGAAAMDFSLSQIVDLIKDVKLAKTGFAFFAQSQGNVLAVHKRGEKILGLTSKTDSDDSQGVSVLKRNLHQSNQNDIKTLKLPTDDKIHMESISLVGESGKPEKFVVVTKRMDPIMSYDGTTVSNQHWTLGFVVSEAEIYEALIVTQSRLKETVKRILFSQVTVGVMTLLIVLLGVLLVAKRMTAGLIALAGAARKLRSKDYSVRVQINSEDEVGQLGDAFNSMAGEIEQYTQNLEKLVRDRTRELEDANIEISQLNARLSQENLRLGAEMAVAQQLQLMVLPKSEELKAITDLDIAGYMKPADEVGGDYYDVLQSNGIVKIGIGDVTGHGLSSGVLMLMVQSITRALLESGEYNPVRFLSMLNNVLYKNIKRINSEKNITLSFIDYKDGEIVLSGQHEEVIVAKAGNVERINTMDLGFPIGLEPDVSPFVATKTIPMERGDVIVLFTDGITEADNADRQQFGIDKLCKSIASRRDMSADEIRSGVISDLAAHIGKQKVYDDITIVVIKMK